jgi:hypothetical protein
MNSTKGPSAYFLLDHVLVDAMLSNAIVLAGDIFGSSIEGLLYVDQRHSQLKGTVVMTLTCLADDGTRRWCRRGLS